MYPVLIRDNLMIPIQMQLSQKQDNLSQFFGAFLRATLNFGHYEQKGDPHRFWDFEIKYCENVVREMSKKLHLREPFGKQHGKHAQALLKSISQQLYHIH